MSISLTQNPGLNSGNLKSQIKSPRGYIVESVLLIIIGGLFWWFMVVPKQASVSDEAAKFNALSSQEEKISAASDTLQKLIADLDTNRQQIVQMDQALPLSDTVPRLHLLIDGIVQSSGVTVGSLNISGSNANDVIAGNKALLSNPFGSTRSLKTYFVAMSVNGSFDQIMALLQKLENSGRIMDITSLGLTASGSGVLTLQINLSVYSLSS
jgi:Tfp pilus assembly protein PilO